MWTGNSDWSWLCAKHDGLFFWTEKMEIAQLELKSNTLKPIA